MSRFVARALAGFPLFLVVMLVGACGTEDPKSPDGVDIKEPATIVSFGAEPTTLEGAGTTILSWETENAVSLAMTRNGSSVDLGDAPFAAGSVSVTIDETSVFELIAVGADAGSVSSQLTVEVVEVPVAPTIGSFSGPEVVEADELGKATLTLSWSGVVGAETLVLEADNADPRIIDPSETPDGSIEVEIVADTTFQLVATNEIGETTESTEVRIVQLPVIASFTASRLRVGIGESTELHWSTLNTASVGLLVEGEEVLEMDPTLLEGSRSITMTLPATLTLRAFNELGTVAEENIDVDVSPPVVETLSANSESLWVGETLTIQWTSEGGSWMSVTSSGVEEPLCESFELGASIDDASCSWDPPLGDHVVTVWVSNSSGTDSLSLPIRVGEGPAIGSFKVEPAMINLGDDLTVSWEVFPDPSGTEAALVLRDDAQVTYPVEEQASSLQIPWTGRTGRVEFELVATTDDPRSVPANATAVVDVYGPPQVDFKATPTHFDHQVEEVTLSWTTEFAGSVVIQELVDGAFVDIATISEDELAAGSIGVDPLVDASYRIVVTSPMGLIETEELSVTVALPEILDLSADVSAVKFGGPVKLSWTTRMADEISFDFQNSEYVFGESQEPYINAKANGGTKLPLHPTDCGSHVFTSSCVRFAFPDGFAFPFDGKSHSEVRVYNNGFISFEPDHMTQVTAGNSKFPQTGTYFYVHMAPLWDYWSWMQEWEVWVPGQEFGDIHYLLQENPVKGRSLIIQWNDARISSTYTASLNFEIVLWESGNFEYRFGDMDPGSNPTAATLEAVRGATSTIGYQTPSGSSFHNIHDQRSLVVHGELFDRTFTYSPIPDYPKNGSYDWRPLATNDTVKATMTVKRGPHIVTKDVSVRIIPRPEILLGTIPTEPVAIGSGAQLTWTTKFATGLQVLDQFGDVICTAADQFAVDDGYCVLDVPEGEYTFTVRATGEDGTFSERSADMTLFTPFSIEKFEADRTGVEEGEPITLTWETINPTFMSLTANGTELLPAGPPVASGSLEIPSISEDTTFVLRLTNTVGMEEVHEVKVVLWTARLELSADQSSVRPGSPATITITATDLGGGPAPTVYGSFPMTEVTGGTGYEDISPFLYASQAALSSDSLGYAVISLPPGFEFPFYGQKFTELRAMADGYITFDMGTTSGSGNNRILPDLSTVASYQLVHLAPFWDDLWRRSSGSLWHGQPDPDTFVIQWKKWSKSTGSTADIEYDLNFQVVLKRDGSFEYRYGTMAPPPPPNVHASCYPETCVNDANGASATIGFQAPDMDAGMTHHHGGNLQAATNIPYPGGLSNKVIRYEPRVGVSTVTVNPTRDETYTFCVDMGGTAACRSIDIAAPIGIDWFTADETTLDFGDSTTLRWQTHGGSRLRILDTAANVLLDTSDIGVVDNGTLLVTPTENAVYQLELTAPQNLLTDSLQVDVTRVRMTLTAPATSFPGSGISLSWNLAVADPNLHPVIVAPMEERSDLPFAAMDISQDEDVEVLYGSASTTGMKEVVFDEGFTFDFLGTPMSKMKVAVEGYISFDSGTTTGTVAANAIIPSDTAANRRINLAPFWDDFSTFSKGRVLVKKRDADTYVVQWSRVSLATGALNNTREYDLSFLVVLHRNGDFEYRYGAMLPPPTPTTSTTACYPQTCENEANGAAATIGYQDPTGTVGFMLHWGGNPTPNPNNAPVPQGLSNRSWKFTKTTARTGSVQVNPWSTTEYNLCAIDPVSGDTFCPDQPVVVDVPWGIEAFDVGPTDPRRGDPVTLSWSVAGLDELRLLRNGFEVFAHTGSEIPATGTLVQNPVERSVYVLEATSLGRVVSVERLVGIRTFELSVVGPSGKTFPGETAPLNWSIAQQEPGVTITTGPMVEVPAGPGDPGAFVDIAGLPGAAEVTITGSGGTGYYAITLPFAFPYFGTPYTEAKAMVDGYLTFDMGVTSGVGANETLPSPASTTRVVHMAPFWDDFFVRTPSKLWIHSPDANTFIIQWKDVSRSNGSSNANPYDMNFQIVLYSDGVFEYRYGKMAPPPGLNNSSCYPSTCELEANGSSATIGFQSVDGMAAQLLHYGGNNEASVVPFKDGLSNRTFRVQTAASGVESIVVDSSKDRTFCAWVRDFGECKTVGVQALVDPEDLMVTEVMLAPAGGQSEQWFELRNLSSDPIDLNRFEIRNTRGTYAVGSSLVVPPLGHAVFAASAISGVTQQAVYGSDLSFDAGRDKLEVWAGSSMIASMEWDATWSFPAGKTLYVDPVAQIKGRATPPLANWCEGSLLGTPGAIDLPCNPNPYYEVDPNGVGSLIDISTVGTRSSAFESAGAVTQLDVPGFSWNYFGTEVTTVWAGIRGWLSFDVADPAGGTVGPPSLTALPRVNTATPRGPLVAGFWENLTCNRSAHDCFFTYFYGDVAGQKVLIAEWDNFRIGNTTVTGITFQIQLWEDGDVKVVFGEFDNLEIPGSTNYNYFRGSTAWIALETMPRDEPDNYITGLHRLPGDLSNRTFHFKAK